MPPSQRPAKGHANIEEFRRASTALISDNLGRLVAARGLRPFHKGGMMIGRALTVRTRAGDNLVVHEALERIIPGDVLVVDGGGDESRALVGEIIVAIARARGAAGIVIDGAIRDVREIGAGEFPCFARSVTHAGPYKDGPGEIGVPVNIGGMVVQPGDVVVGDEDGVVAFPESLVDRLLDAVNAQLAREAEILRSIAEGRYEGSYGRRREDEGQSLVAGEEQDRSS
ncbi:RraA family protein [Sphingosinicella sp. CPCC 101087]|uniref:RraA family protein n=1 Tax=Sphingosinicella sp. CPCC 101087 TaxID=2497754 RepID=UPI00101BEE1E|nr:RraA family protein [Sphingosinicella sp. CPCC 101087]